MHRFLIALAFVLTLMLTSAGLAQADTEYASWYGPGLYGNATASGEILV